MKNVAENYPYFVVRGGRGFLKFTIIVKMAEDCPYYSRIRRFCVGYFIDDGQIAKWMSVVLPFDKDKRLHGTSLCTVNF